MPVPDEIGDDELLYRKIPVSMNRFDPELSSKPSPEAFHPNRAYDRSGISVDRAQSQEHLAFRSIEEAGRGKSSQGYYVAVLRTGDLRARGIMVVSTPRDGDPGHAELPDLNAENRRSQTAKECKRILADELTLRVEGPFNIRKC